MDLQTLLPILDAQVKEVFQPYEALGYRHTGTAIASSRSLGDYLDSRWCCDTTGRMIEVHFLPPVVGALSAFGALAIFLNDRSAATFEVRDGMRLKGASDAEIAPFLLDNHPGTLVERIHAALVAAKAGIDGYLQNVLSGKEWLRVPINWGDHR